MQALRALAGDAYILYFLFTTYDLKQARRPPVAMLLASGYNEGRLACLLLTADDVKHAR